MYIFPKFKTQYKKESNAVINLCLKKIYIVFLFIILLPYHRFNINRIKLCICVEYFVCKHI